MLEKKSKTIKQKYRQTQDNFFYRFPPLSETKMYLQEMNQIKLSYALVKLAEKNADHEFACPLNLGSRAPSCLVLSLWEKSNMFSTIAPNKNYLGVHERIRLVAKMKLPKKSDEVSFCSVSK